MTPKSKRGIPRSTEGHLARTHGAFIDWVNQILVSKGWTPTELAKRSGLAPSTILRILYNKDQKHRFNISFMTVRKVAEGAACSIPKTLLEANSFPDKILPAGESDVCDRVAIPKPNLDAAPAIAAPETSERMLRKRFVSTLPFPFLPKVREEMSVPCPPQLLADDLAFAFEMPDDSLGPLVRAGMLLYATSRRTPAAGDILLLIDNDDRQRVSFVKDVDENGLHLERFTGEHREEIVPFNRIRDFGVVEGIWRR